MGCSKDQTTKTTAVTPGATVKGDLAAAGALRFERVEGAMTGEAVMSVQDGTLTLHYADGATVHLTT